MTKNLVNLFYQYHFDLFTLFMIMSLFQTNVIPKLIVQLLLI